MKNIMNKILFASVLIGLLVYTGCDDPLDVSAGDTSRDVSTQTGEDAGGLPQEDQFDGEGCEWLTVYNEDGTYGKYLGTDCGRE